MEGVYCSRLLLFLNSSSLFTILVKFLRVDLPFFSPIDSIGLTFFSALFLTKTLFHVFLQVQILINFKTVLCCFNFNKLHLIFVNLKLFGHDRTLVTRVANKNDSRFLNLLTSTDFRFQSFCCSFYILAIQLQSFHQSKSVLLSHPPFLHLQNV